MRKSTLAVVSAAILGSVTLAACDLLGGGGDEKKDDGTAEGGSESPGGGGESSGGKPADEGAGGGSEAGDSGDPDSGGGGDGKPDEDGGASGGGASGVGASAGGGGSGGGGSGMREVGNVIEGFSGQLDGYLDVYQQNLAAGFGPSGVQDVITGLQAGSEYRWNVGNLRAGQTYRFLGACDQDCTDVDIVVEDASGNAVGSDYALDDHPVVTVTPRQDGQYTVRILLVDCEIEPCYVAGRVLQQGR